MNEKEKKLNDMINKYNLATEELQSFKEKYRKNEAEIVRLQSQISNLNNQLSQYEAQKRELEQLNDHWENSARILEYSKNDLEEKLYQAEESVIMYKEELDEISQLKQIEIQRLKDESRELKEEIMLLQAQKADSQKVSELESALHNALRQHEQLKAELEKPKIHKTTCTTEAMTPAGTHSRQLSIDSSNNSTDETPPQNIRVVARVRPLLPNESASCLGCSQ